VIEDIAHLSHSSEKTKLSIMKAVALEHSVEGRPNRRGFEGRPGLVPRSASALSPENAVIQRQVSCSCGGGCPRCESRHEVQAKLRISTSGDASEREADRLVEQITSTPHRSSEDRSSLHQHNSEVHLQRKCAACSAGASCPQCEDAGEALVQTKKSGSVSENTGTSVPDNLLHNLGGGQSLPESVQEEFGPRLGRNLSDVRVHTGPAADVATAAVGARAFTLGRDLVFAPGEFAPGTGEGRRLIAHELVHWVQQGGRADRIQRTLKIDHAASDDPKTAVDDMKKPLQKLCPGFDVDGKSGVVTAQKDSDCAKGEFGKVAIATNHKLGCCCLCTLARAPQKWTIVVSITRAPTTDRSARVVRMTPTSGASVPDLRYWTGGSPEKMVSLPPEEGLGHELCGHAALHQALGHPPDETGDTARTFSDIHDPTVKIQNVLAGKDELALGSTPRGLAASGAHHGESLRVFAVTPFAVDDAKISAPLQTTIDGAAVFADGNPRQLIDIVGFSDSKDTVKGIGKTRADAVRKALEAKMKKKDKVEFTLSKGAKPTEIARLQPTIDGGVATARTVEIRLAREPAGLVNLPAGVKLPATPEHVGPETPLAVEPVLKGKKGLNACHDLLITTAWK
jgi:outer membrane protein OmpA-like peptidoglycan-associated protein